MPYDSSDTHDADLPGAIVSGLAPGLTYKEAYFASSGSLFKASPDLLVIHSASVGNNPAKYLLDPTEPEDAYLQQLRLGGHPVGKILTVTWPPDAKGRVKKQSLMLCKDKHWRRPACAHICAQSQEGDWLQTALLTRVVWHAGGSTCEGKGHVNDRSIGIELPAKAGAGLFDSWQSLLLNLLPTVPSIQKWTTHRWILPKLKRDPVCWSNGQVRLAMDGFGLTEVGER